MLHRRFELSLIYDAEKYLEDVEKLEKEEHVLEPKTYIPRRKCRLRRRNEDVMRQNREHQCVDGGERRREVVGNHSVTLYTL